MPANCLQCQTYWTWRRLTDPRPEPQIPIYFLCPTFGKYKSPTKGRLCELIVEVGMKPVVHRSLELM